MMSEAGRLVPPLPIPLTGFVGRERELGEIDRLFERTRLVTLTGVGGCGKSRLALEFGMRLARRIDDRVWFIELASERTESGVLAAVADTVGVSEQPGQSLIDLLVARLTAQPGLLIFDNCEQAVDACAGLTVALLRTCPDLRILGTSRESLAVTGEVVFRVPPLTLPDQVTGGLLEQLTHSEAGQLFLDRALASRTEFAFNDDDAAAIAEICRSVDGLPLAIELAAARVNVLSVRQIAERLDDRFALLTRAGRTPEPRHRALRATMDWSYELLTAEEQRFFRRLGVFAGGFSLEAASAVTGVGAALDLVDRLVDKSLVIADVGADQSRYRLLETVREYAIDRLALAGELEAIRRAHLDHFLSFAEIADTALRTPEVTGWLARLAIEHDNLRAALNWCLDAADSTLVERVLRLVVALAQYWCWSGQYREGSAFLERALNRAGFQDGRWDLEHEELVPLALRARTMRARADIARFRGNMPEARQALEHAILLLRQMSDDRELARSLRSLGHVSHFLNDPKTTQACGEESLRLARQVGDRQTEVGALIVLCEAQAGGGNYEGSIPFIEEAISLAREIGDWIMVVSSLNSLGEIARSQGDYHRAKRLYEESLTLDRINGRANPGYAQLHNLGYVALRLNDPHEACARFREVLELAVVNHLINWRALSLAGLAATAAVLNQPEMAAVLHGAAESQFGQLGYGPEPIDRAEMESLLERARAELGDERYQSLRQEGSTLAVDEFVTRAAGFVGQTAVPSGQRPADLLSRREEEVLRLVALGLTNAEIGERLIVSRYTVNAHLRSIFRKLDVTSRAAAGRWASANLDPEPVN